MDYQDYYQTLGVPRTASQADIKKAFRKQAREHHPDKKPGDKAAEARFKAVNEANAVLSDPDKRKKYDRLGKDWEAYARAGVDPDAAGSPFGQGRAYTRSASGSRWARRRRPLRVPDRRERRGSRRLLRLLPRVLRGGRRAGGRRDRSGPRPTANRRPVVR